MMAALTMRACRDEDEIMKGWLTSKTLWFNVVAAVLVVFMDSIGTASIDPMWQSLVVTLGNFCLRFLTAEPLAIGSPTSTNTP